MTDYTENIRRKMVADINSKDNTRASLEAEHGQVWDTDELQRDFLVKGFMSPFVVVKRKRDGAVGSLEFCHSPRFYYNFQLDR